ncbi:MAG TPA: flagellin [Bryobacteraceae bacterium]|nr:flagellin [Bryobacteraceae bacterium]
MDLTINGANQQYLSDLQQTQAQIAQAQAQLSSGYRLQKASDDPTALSQIYELQTKIAFNQQTQNNLSGAQSELSAADTALQSSITALTSAVTLAAQGANSNYTADQRANLAIQVQGIQQSLVSLSQTQVNGQYIFSGDQDTQPLYQLDSTQPNGVKQLATATNTRTIQDVNGTAIATARTATTIFDAQDSSGAPVTGNVFAAVQSLITALQNNDTAGIATASDALKSAGDYLNGQLAFYGTAENRVADATQLAQKFMVQDQTDLGNVQNADVPTAALQLTQAQTQQEAALSVEAKIQQQPNLFSMLG